MPLNVMVAKMVCKVVWVLNACGGERQETLLGMVIGWEHGELLILYHDTRLHLSKKHILYMEGLEDRVHLISELKFMKTGDDS